MPQPVMKKVGRALSKLAFWPILVMYPCIYKGYWKFALNILSFELLIDTPVKCDLTWWGGSVDNTRVRG